MKLEKIKTNCNCKSFDRIVLENSKKDKEAAVQEANNAFERKALGQTQNENV